MANEIHEIIRVLQLTTYDEGSSEQDSLTVLRGLQNQLGTKLNMASEWLNVSENYHFKYQMTYFRKFT